MVLRAGRRARDAAAPNAAPGRDSDPPASSASSAIARPAPASSAAREQPVLQERAPIDSLILLWVHALHPRSHPRADGGAGAGGRAGPAAAAAASGSRPARRTTLDNSALQAGSVTVSPLPGSRDATPQTQISFLGVPAGDLSRIERRRLAQRRARGRLAPTRRATARAFCRRGRLRKGERVTVRAHVRGGRRRPPASRPVRDRP